GRCGGACGVRCRRSCTGLTAALRCNRRSRHCDGTVSARFGRRRLLRRGRFRGIIGYIPACALELDRWSGDQFLQRAATLRADRLRCCAKTLNLFKTMLALLALVLVKRHCYNLLVKDISTRIMAWGAQPTARLSP